MNPVIQRDTCLIVNMLPEKVTAGPNSSKEPRFEFPLLMGLPHYRIAYKVDKKAKSSLTPTDSREESNGVSKFSRWVRLPVLHQQGFESLLINRGSLVKRLGVDKRDITVSGVIKQVQEQAKGEISRQLFEEHSDLDPSTSDIVCAVIAHFGSKQRFTFLEAKALCTTLNTLIGETGYRPSSFSPESLLFIVEYYTHLKESSFLGANVNIKEMFKHFIRFIAHSNQSDCIFYDEVLSFVSFLDHQEQQVLHDLKTVKEILCIAENFKTISLREKAFKPVVWQVLNLMQEKHSTLTEGELQIYCLSSCTCLYLVGPEVNEQVLNERIEDFATILRSGAVCYFSSEFLLELSSLIRGMDDYQVEAMSCVARLMSIHHRYQSGKLDQARREGKDTEWIVESLAEDFWKKLHLMLDSLLNNREESISFDKLERLAVLWEIALNSDKFTQRDLLEFVDIAFRCNYNPKRHSIDLLKHTIKGLQKEFPGIATNLLLDYAFTVFLFSLRSRKENAKIYAQNAVELAISYPFFLVSSHALSKEDRIFMKAALQIAVNDFASRRVLVTALKNEWPTVISSSFWQQCEINENSMALILSYLVAGSQRIDRSLKDLHYVVGEIQRIKDIASGALTEVEAIEAVVYVYVTEVFDAVISEGEKYFIKSDFVGNVHIGFTDSTKTIPMLCPWRKYDTT